MFLATKEGCEILDRVLGDYLEMYFVLRVELHLLHFQWFNRLCFRPCYILVIMMNNFYLDTMLGWMTMGENAFSFLKIILPLLCEVS